MHFHIYEIFKQKWPIGHFGTCSVKNKVTCATFKLVMTEKRVSYYGINDISSFQHARQIQTKWYPASQSRNVCRRIDRGQTTARKANYGGKTTGETSSN